MARTVDRSWTERPGTIQQGPRMVDLQGKTI